MKKKAQVQNMETIVVIIIVVIMMVIGLVLVTKNKKNNIEQDLTELNEMKAMDVAIVASNLNELKCSDYSAMIKTCFDYQRLVAFSNIVNQNKQNSFDYYYSLLGNSKISIQIIKKYDPVLIDENITLYDYNNSANKSSFPVFIPTIVLNSIEEQSYFAIIEVRTYS
jgi:hypothetical protein